MPLPAGGREGTRKRRDPNTQRRTFRNALARTSANFAPYLFIYIYLFIFIYLAKMAMQKLPQ
jgi:hypothetical protein